MGQGRAGWGGVGTGDGIQVLLDCIEVLVSKLLRVSMSVNNSRDEV